MSGETLPPLVMRYLQDNITSHERVSLCNGHLPKVYTIDQVLKGK